ncbi:MAG: gluconate 2-dehydrogenase subunit 3 family protein [Verrucomicrobiota bacterium]
MNRREVLKVLGTVFAGTVYGAKAFSQGTPIKGRSAADWAKGDVALLDEIGEVIIPTTSDSPGAKAAKIGEYMVEFVDGYYSDEERDSFLRGLDVFKKQCQEETGGSFVQLDAEQKGASVEALTRSRNRSFFQKLSQLTVAGYFTSKIGMTQARTHLPIPTRWESCIDLKPGQKSWA